MLEVMRLKRGQGWVKIMNMVNSTCRSVTGRRPDLPTCRPFNLTLHLALNVNEKNHITIS